MKLVNFLLAALILGTACGGAQTPPASQPSAAGTAPSAAAPEPALPGPEPEAAAAPSQTERSPKTVREFFELLPEMYFALEGCDKRSDPRCVKARAEYLKTFLEVDDPKNGYLKASCDGAQTCITMALFKRPDGSYLVAVNTMFEAGDDYYFLNYSGGKWTDVSAEVIPGFSKRKMYELPRYGTRVKVFAKKVIEEVDGYEFSEKGDFLYELEWKDGKFLRK